MLACTGGREEKKDSADVPSIFRDSSTDDFVNSYRRAPTRRDNVFIRDLKGSTTLIPNDVKYFSCIKE